MAQVFISYASVDRERVKGLAEAMQARGYTVWWDRQIAPGQTFDEVIEKALDEASCVVVLWSSTSVKSDWVKTEASEAAKRKVLVPAVIDKVTIPLEFRRIQAADLTQWDGRNSNAEFEKFLAAIDLEIKGNSPGQAAPQTSRSVSSTSAAAATMAVDPRPAQKSRDFPAPSPAAKVARPGFAKWVIGAAVLLAAAVGVVLWLNPTNPTNPTNEVPTPSPSAQIPDVVGMAYDAAAATLKGNKFVAERR